VATTVDGVESSSVKVGLLGCGNVGAALVNLMTARRESVALRTGIALDITRIAVRDLKAVRPGVDLELLVTDAAAVVADPEVDLVVELIGGIEPARSLILNALNRGKPVITGNKALLASHGAELFAAADANGVDLLFEAAVAGGIPLIRPLRESLIGEEVTRMMGIVNGTTNYILTRMTEAGADYADALAEAQALGFAEADPTADVEGHDAAAKAAILATIAFGVNVTAADVSAQGISSISAVDVDYATKLGFVIKLLAVAEEIDGQQSVRVHPAMVPKAHPLASVREAFNAVFVEGSSVGQLMFYGRGAGGGPTSSAVFGDLVDAAVNLRKGTHASIGTFADPSFISSNDLQSAYYLSIDVNDKPGVLAAVANEFGAHAVSIRSMEQEGIGAGARIIFITHAARQADINACVAGLKTLEAVTSVNSLLRVIAA
jgi:homoserine dehydrogenase